MVLPKALAVANFPLPESGGTIPGFAKNGDTPVHLETLVGDRPGPTRTSRVLRFHEGSIKKE